MFLYKNQIFLIFSFLSIPIELWESTAAIFRQSAGYVLLSFGLQIITFIYELEIITINCKRSLY